MNTEKRFAELDGLRGLAALTVVIEHLSNAHMAIAPNWFFLGGQSRIAVWVFFALSSFLLTTQSITTSSDDRSEWTFRYALRRVFRIYPLFLFCIVVDVISQRMSLIEAFKYLTLQTLCCSGIYWAIPPEFIYYAFIPMIGAAAARSPLISAIGLSMAATASIYFGTRYNFWTFASTFCIGSVAAIVLVQWPKFANKLSQAWPLAPIVGVICSGPVVRAMGFSSVPWDWNGMHGALWATFILACAREEPYLKWLSNKLLRFLGAISFSLYLTHPWVLALAGSSSLSGMYSGGLVLCFAILLAALTFRVIEKPGMKLGRLIEKRLINRFWREPKPITLPPRLRSFLISLGPGKAAVEVERENSQLLDEAQRWGLVYYDYGSHQDNGYYAVTRLGRASLKADDRLAPFRS